MKYLFFDIESPDGSPYAICEFGYVITDENFNILDRNNLLINPEKKIKPIYRRGELKIKLFYPPYKYFQSPLFPSRYPVIRNLLTKDDVKVFGYSVSSDITYIRSTSTKYNLEQFNYSSYDVQLIYRDLMKLAKCTSLENAAQIVPESEKNNFSLHRADHDATITMLVLKHLVKNNNINLNEFLSSNENYKFNSQYPPKKNNKPNKSKTSKKNVAALNKSMKLLNYLANL